MTRSAEAWCHYGPVYGRPTGESFALCAPSVESGHSAALTTHLPWIDCPACLAKLEAL